MSSTEEAMYKKRIKTTGLSGQLYETELVGIALFKLLHDERIEYFYLASNLDEIGCFDDLCFKAKIKGIDRPLLVFIQAKHKDNDNAYVDFDEAKHFHDSYSRVVQKFYTSANDKKNKDKIFIGNFEDYECVFILYTNGKYKNDSGIDYESAYSSVLNELISTGRNGTKLNCTEQIVEDLVQAVLKVEIEGLAEHFTKFLSASQSMQMMLDDDVKRYHLVLALHAVEVSEIYSDEKKPDFKWRNMRFREDFFTSNDKNIMMLRKAMFKKLLQNHAILKNKKPIKDPKLEEQLQTFFKQPCLNTLSPLIGTCIVYKNEKLEFAFQRTDSEKEMLKQIKLSQDVIEDAEAIVARNILLSPELRELKVPVTFGNTDLMISERRITHLAKNIIDLCNKFELQNGHKIVTLDETVDPGILNINGGLGGTVGNLLVYEESTKLLRFVDSSTSLPNNAQLLFEKLKKDLNELHVYRFYVKPMLPFPVLSFDCDSGIARKITNKLVIYAGQSDQLTLETKLKKLIEDHQNAKYPNMQVEAESLFQNYHSNIQTWSLLKAKGPYLTKDSKTYQEALNNILFEPQMSLLRNTFHMTKMKHIEYSTESLKTLHRLSRQKDEEEELKLAELAVIVTDVAVLTAIKVIQYLKSNGVNSYSTLDLERLLNLPTEDFCALKLELKKTEKILLVMCHNLQNEIIWHEKYLKEISQAMEGKRKIVITNSIYVDMVQNIFLSSDNEKTKKEIDDEDLFHEKHSLFDLTQESQEIIMKNSNVTFQGLLTRLDVLLDDTSKPFIEGSILNKIVFNETIKIGELYNDVNYDKIIHLYQDRTVELIKYHLISGRICISRVCATDDSQASSINKLPPEQEWKKLDGSILYACFGETGVMNNPRGMYFNFFFRLKAENGANFNLELKAADGLILFKVKIKNFTTKVWKVKVTFFDDSMQFGHWLTNYSVAENTFENMWCLCKDTVVYNLILNEEVEVTPIDRSKNRNTKEFSLVSLFSNVKENLDNNTSLKNDIANNVTIDEVQTVSGHNISSNGGKKNNGNNISRDGGHTSSENNANTDNAQRDPVNNASVGDAAKDSENNVSSNKAQKDPILKIFEMYMNQGAFKYVQDINVFVPHNLQDETLIRNRQKNSGDNVSGDNVTSEETSSKCEENAYDFQFRYRSKHRIELKSFDDLKDDVILLTAKAGLGKSTLLTHLSRKINTLDNHVWVVRMNLLNYSGEFRKWQQLENIEIDALPLITLNMIVKAVFNNVTIDLKEDSEKITLENCSGDEWTRLNVKMFLNYYNKGKLLFLFDGFDEICPDFKNEVILFLSVIQNDPRKNKMWITSRPYNAILPELEQRFGKSFRLEYMNKTEQTDFLRRYWETSLNLRDPNVLVDKGILEGLLIIISRMIAGHDIKLKIICFSFYQHLVAKFPTELSDKIKSPIEIENFYKTVSEGRNSEVNEFMGTPLLLKLMADFTLHKVLNFDVDNETRVSVIDMYEWFIENKLVNVLFKEKYGMDVDMPFLKENCVAELIQILTSYKKLGALAIFGNPIFVRNGLNLEEMNDLTPFDFRTENGRAEFKAAVISIWTGKDKTGLISYITYGGIPVFIHKTFAEYFAVEYISDILTDETVAYEAKRLVLTVILSIMIDESVVDDRGKLVSRGSLGNWVLEKLSDDEEFCDIFNEIVEQDTKYRGVTNNVSNETLREAYRILLRHETN